jgi:hypothetical protein
MMSERRSEDGWIEWAGGKRPVDGETLVEVKLRDGTVYDDTGEELAWSHDRHREFADTDIIAYRVVEVAA